jgi:hypothetical protein
LIARYANANQGMHPLVKTMEVLERDAARYGALLGLDPVNAKRLTGGQAAGSPGRGEQFAGQAVARRVGRLRVAGECRGVVLGLRRPKTRRGRCLSPPAATCAC